MPESPDEFMTVAEVPAILQAKRADRAELD
jgi:hypothetical protein